MRGKIKIKIKNEIKIFKLFIHRARTRARTWARNFNESVLMEMLVEHSAQNNYEMHAIVKGSVQGVGFRATTRQIAISLGITGTVRNLPDGTVEIYAHGSKKSLSTLMQALKEEFGASHVKEELIKYFPIEFPHDDFRIIH